MRARAGRRAFGLCLALCLLGSAGAAHAHDPSVHAPTPTGGVSWDVLGATGVMPWVDADGVNRLAPQFDAAVEALDGATVRLAGYAMHHDGKQGQFTLYASSVDCEFHATPGPNLRVEVALDTPAQLGDGVQWVEGRLELVRARSGGVFYRLHAGKIAKRVISH